jgi:hypothetical protein
VPQEAIVIYDDDCGFCRWSLALLLNLDRGALRPLPLGTAEADYLLHDLSTEERNASWHVVIDPPGPDQLSFDAAPARFSAAAASRSSPPASRARPNAATAGWRSIGASSATSSGAGRASGRTG